jgi:LPS sulfotransferase NodH
VTSIEANASTPLFDDGVRRFVVLFEGRSGSTYLVEALASHPDIHARKEYFAALAKRVKDRDAQPGVQLSWARNFYSSESCAGYGAVGFKTKWLDILEPEAFADFLRRGRFRILLLQRRNRIKLVVSLFRAVQLAEETGQWNLYDERHRQAPMAIDPQAFAQRLAAVQARNLGLRQFAAGLGLPTLELYYEDILENDQLVFDRVCRFLEVSPQPLAGRTRKHTSDDLRDALANFDELRSAYAGTPYQPMFDEVLIDPSCRPSASS